MLNNDWSTYNEIKTAEYNDLLQKGNLIITNDVKDAWSRFYNYSQDGRVTSEKEYVEPDFTNEESPLACDLSDMLIATNLSNGKIRVELIGSTMFDIYEWTFSDGSKAYGNPINIDCNQKSNGSVTLDVWNLNPGVPAGKQRICHGSILYYCNCGVKKEKKDKHIWTNAGGSGKEITIEAAIWVKDGEIGCKSKHFAKNFLGIWVPLNLIFNTTGVCANLAGSFTKEVSQGNCIIVNVPFNEKCMSVGSPNGSWQNIITQTGKNFIDPGKLSSGHRLRLKTGGTFFGFGVDKPRLVLN